MAIEKVKELLKAVKTDAEAQAKLNGLVKPADEDGIVKYYAEAASLLGFDVTEEDIRATIAALSKEQQGKTDAAVGMVKAIPDDTLDQVAGGYQLVCAEQQRTCIDTYKNQENCWTQDGCDRNTNMYTEYKCAHNYAGHTCGDKEAVNCSSFIF